MLIEEITCSNCAASKLKLGDDGFYHCEYCDSTFNIIGATKGHLDSAKISGSMINDFNVYAVHGFLKINGSMNNIKVVRTSKHAVHVENLTVNGSMNKATVVLLDGASIKTNGSMNKVERI